MGHLGPRYVRMFHRHDFEIFHPATWDIEGVVRGDSSLGQFCFHIFTGELDWRCVKFAHP